LIVAPKAITDKYDEQYDGDRTTWTITATDGVRLGEKRIAILAGPVELVENNIPALPSPAQRKCPGDWG
jgi:hypothetical protein